MAARKYLPSAQFLLIVTSIGLSAGLVYAAELVTKPNEPIQIVSVGGPAMPQAAGSDWQSTLTAFQEGGVPSSENGAATNEAAAKAKGSNLTENLGKTLLAQIGSIPSGSLEDSDSTKNSIISQALQQLPQPQQSAVYIRSNLVLAPDTLAARRSYGNIVITTLKKHPGASMAATLQAVADAVNTNQPQTDTFAAVEKQYRALTKDLAAIPVPETYAPLQLNLLNDFTRIADTYPDLSAMATDPVRGLAGLQHYKTVDDDLQSVFINIAQQLSKDGILWSKDEPGALWNSLLSAQ